MMMTVILIVVVMTVMVLGDGWTQDMTEKCFKKCITSPSTSLSGNDKVWNYQCYELTMDEAWWNSVCLSLSLSLSVLQGGLTQSFRCILPLSTERSEIGWKNKGCPSCRLFHFKSFH